MASPEDQRLHAYRRFAPKREENGDSRVSGSDREQRPDSERDPDAGGFAKPDGLPPGKKSAGTKPSDSAGRARPGSGAGGGAETAVSGLIRTVREAAGSERDTSEGRAAGESSGTRNDAPDAGEEAGATGSYRKIAKLLLILGRETASEVLRHLGEQEAELISREIARLPGVRSEEAERILAEFGASRIAAEEVRGGREVALSMLEQAFGKQQAESLLARVLPAEPRRYFDFLNELKPNQILPHIRGESGPVLAIIFSALEPRIASALLKELDSGRQNELIRRMGRMESVDGVVLERMADVLRERIRTGGTTVTEELDGRAALAEILRRMAPGSEEEILSELPAEVSEAIRERLFTVDSLLQIRDQDLQEILRDYGDHDIALVLKGKAEPIRAKILRNVSERRRTLIAEEYAHLGPRPQREIASVTRDFLAHLRRLEEQGRLLVRDRGDEYI